MSLGSMVTKARMDAGLTIDDLAAVTNLRASALREIEKDNFSPCGGETYARGHLRNIAAIVNIDPQIFLTAFEDEQMRVDRSIRDHLKDSSVIRADNEPRKISWKILIAISLVTMLVIAFGQIVVSSNSTPDIPLAVQESAAPTQSPEVSAPSEEIMSTGQGVKVVITATRATSWLFVSDSNGTTLFSGQISTGGSRSFSSSEQLNLRIGNAGGVDLVVNGKKLEPLGINGQVVSVSYGVDS